MRRLLVAAGIAALLIGAWTACTGDAPAVAEQGALGQPCRADGTCAVADLKCAAGLCQLASAAAEGGGSSSGTSGALPAVEAGTSSSSSSSSGSPDNCVDLKAPPMLTCPVGGKTVSCATNQLCCPGKGCVTGATCEYDGGARPGWQCFGPTTCEGAGCYVVAAFLDKPDGGASCGVQREIFLDDNQVSVGSCLGGAPARSVRLCNDPGDCGNSPCAEVALVLEGEALVVKACTPVQ